MEARKIKTNYGRKTCKHTGNIAYVECKGENDIQLGFTGDNSVLQDWPPCEI